jgi:hypothetical protein
VFATGGNSMTLGNLTISASAGMVADKSSTGCGMSSSASASIEGTVGREWVSTAEGSLCGCCWT